MEVKIKDNNELVDATIEMIDGVMIVAPKKVKFETKDGDIVANEEQLFIVKQLINEEEATCYLFLDEDGELDIEGGEYYIDRFATEEEKQRLFQALADEGWEWDVKERKLVKVKWKPSEGESYYYPYNGIVLYGFEVGCSRWDNDEIDQVLYEKGWAFPDTKQGKADCHKLVDKLNEAINSVKP